MITMSSPGDRDRQTDLRESAGDFFTQDLDRAVLCEDVDCAVHSAKDVPTPLPEGLDWCWLPWRADPRDAVVLRPGMKREELPDSPRIGVSSERREAWCRSAFTNGELCSIRGNIEDRLAQLDAGDYDAVVMAAAALVRLGIEDRITEWIPAQDLTVPDGQGVLALTFRKDDRRLARLRGLFVHPVTFVGAGVGTADLCTIAGADALAHCDVCLHDTLMDPALLSHMPANAVCLNVGKRSGAHTVLQEETTDMLLEYARRGSRVVRLKGGDPCIFGRLAEEVEALDGLRMPYRVIPGISSLSVMGASTGILLTRRGVSNGFSVISGRGEGGTTSSVRMADRQRLPLVLFMSLSVLPDLLAQLREDGVADDVPAAVVLSAGSPSEDVLRGTVATIADVLKEATAGADPMPAGLVIVGEVARFGFNNAWAALQGQRVLLTCSEALQPEARRRVGDAGGRPVSLPLIRLVPVANASELMAGCADFDWLVVTSPSAVRCLLGALRDGRTDIRTLPRVLACGPGTLRELRSVGIESHAVPDSGFGADGLRAVAARCIQAGDRVLRVRSDVAGPDLAESLRARGAIVDDICIYRNEPIHCERLPRFDIALFASSSAVSAFVVAWGSDALADRTVLAIGKPTANALHEVGVRDVHVSPEATVEAAIAYIAALCVNDMVCREGE